MYLFFLFPTTSTYPPTSHVPISIVNHHPEVYTVAMIAKTQQIQSCGAFKK